MNSELQVLMEQLVAAMRRSQEYNQYQSLLDAVKQRPELYQRIGEFRRRNIVFQMTDHGNVIEENNELQKEFSDLKANGLANEFMAAEHQYCRMIKSLQDYFLENVDVEIDILND